MRRLLAFITSLALVSGLFFSTPLTAFGADTGDTRFELEGSGGSYITISNVQEGKSDSDGLVRYKATGTVKVTFYGENLIHESINKLPNYESIPFQVKKVQSTEANGTKLYASGNYALLTQPATYHVTAAYSGALSSNGFIVDVTEMEEFELPTVEAPQSTNSDFAIEPQFEAAREFSGGLAAVLVDKKWGFIDKTGKLVIQPKYPVHYDTALTATYTFKDGLAIVSLNDKVGYIDKTGKEVTKLQYDYAFPIEEGLGRVSVGGKTGYINKIGKEVIKPQYYEATDFREGLAVVNKTKETMVDMINNPNRKNVFFIDKNGKDVFNKKFTAATSFSEGLASVKIDGKWGFIDKSGKVVIKPQYDIDASFSEGLAAVEKGGKWSFIDKTGKTVLKVNYPYVNNFKNGLAKFQNQQVKEGFINKAGKVVIQPIYDRIDGEFVDGLVEVRKYSEGYLFLDLKGKVAVTAKGYSTVHHFSEGLAVVTKNGVGGYIDKTGKEVMKPTYRTVSNFSEGLAAVYHNGEWGYISNPLDKPSDWAKAEVDEAVSLDLVPKELQNAYTQNISRADFSKLVVQLVTTKTKQSVDSLLVEQGKKVNPAAFSDTKDSNILMANALGIVNGKGAGKFDPNGLITRQEAAVMLNRTANVLGMEMKSSGNKFEDDRQIASWAKEAVSFVSSTKDKTTNGYVMGGTGNNRFSPTVTYTKQQAMITMKRLFNS